MNASQQRARPATLLDLLKVLGRRPLLLAAGIIAGGLIGLAVAVQTPANYEASAVVRVGTVAMLGDSNGLRAALERKPVETPQQAAERLKLPGFVAESRVDAAPPEEVAKRITVRQVRESDLIEVRYRAPTQQAAEKGLQALVDTLRRRHEQLAQPAKARIAEQLSVLQKLRSESSERRGELLQSLRGAPLPSLRGEYPFLQLAFASQDSELLRWEASLNAALQPPMTTPTQLIEAIAISDNPVTPGRAMLVLAGALAGMLFAAAFVLLRYVRDRRAGAIPQQ